jgi:hypothetical protein
MIDFFLSFLIKYDEKKTHKIITLILDPRFKSLRLNFFNWL